MADLNKRILLAGGMLAAYTVLLVLLAGVRPFWLDEVHQLSDTWQADVPLVIRHVRENPGSVPLGYLLQNRVMALAGFSRLSARLTSILFAALGFAVFLQIARRIGCRWPLLAGILWIVTPLQLRYAVEARSYMQASALLVLALWCLIELLDRPSLSYSAGLALALTLAIYTQPYSAPPILGAVAWLLIKPATRRAATCALAACGASAILFLPWLLARAASWQAQNAAQGFAIQPKLPLLIVRELAGDGYLCSLPLVILAAAGLRAPRIKPAIRACLAAGVVAALGASVLSDAAFHYFFAIRQVMFAVPWILWLAAEGIAFLSEERWKWPALALCAVLAAAAVAKDVAYFSDRSEDWQAAATALAAMAPPPSCIAYTGERPPKLYALFDPSLPARACRGLNAEQVAVPATRYTPAARLSALHAELARAGYALVDTRAAGGTRIEVFRRR
jgi:hypothetical protein